MENKIQNSINLSPNYDQQLEEIEILKNILPEKVTILKSEPNFNIQIEIEGENDEEEPLKTFYLEIFLNNNYPEKSPRFKIYEANDCINDKRKEMLIKKLDDYCEENIGMSVIYQLYEIVKEFADEEEKIALRKKYEEKSGQITYNLNSLQKIKQIKTKDKTYPIDIYEIKNGNILVIYKNGLIKIYDNQYENILFELLQSYSNLPIIFCKYFNLIQNITYLYLFNLKHVYIYKISFLPKKNIINETKFKMNGNIKVEYLTYIVGNDVIELPRYKNNFFLVKNYIEEDDEENFLLYVYDKKNFSYKGISKNDFSKSFRKIHYINPDRFILASYTLRTRKGDISGINKMCLIDSENFKITKSFDLKISPLNNTIETYKKDYLVISYFSTLKDGEENIDDPYYKFNDYLKVNLYPYYDEDEDGYVYGYRNEDEDEDIKKVKFYSYDIKKHYIGIFSIKYEEFVTNIEYEPFKIIYNINDNLLCDFIKKEINNKRTQISYERVVHEYYNYKELDETDDVKDYKTERYLAYIILEYGINDKKGSIDYDNITCIKELNKNYLSICSENKGIILYK